MDISDRLIEIRAKRNLTQKELAELLHVSYVTVSRWETGKVKPTKVAMKKIETLSMDNKSNPEVIKDGH